MINFNDFVDNIKYFLQENKQKTLVISGILIFMTFSAVIALCITLNVKPKESKPRVQKNLVIDQPLMIPNGPVIPDNYITSRNTEKKWSSSEVEKWFNVPDQQELQKLSDTNDRTISEIIGAAP